jgi:shikimate kinase
MKNLDFPDGVALRKTVSLVGIMGSGKTTIGRRLSHILKVDFKDSDAEIERAAGMDISDIFAIHGEEYFRSGEQRVIQRIVEENEPFILATGGGAFVQPKTREILKENTITVWLNTDLDTLVRRTSRRDTRPLLNTGNPRDILSRLLEERNQFYAEADIAINNYNCSLDETVSVLIENLKSFGRVFV